MAAMAAPGKIASALPLPSAPRGHCRQAGSVRRVLCCARQNYTDCVDGSRRMESRRTFSLTAACALSAIQSLSLRIVDAEAAETDEKIRLITNIDEAREIGERRRREKEESQGPIVVLPSGIKFRELAPGGGDAAVAVGDTVTFCDAIYRLNGYYLESLGYGNEGKDDVGEALTVVVGRDPLIRAVEMGIDGMRVGARRRILVPPNLGFTPYSDWLPKPTSAAAGRRLRTVEGKPFLFEVEMLRIRKAGS